MGRRPPAEFAREAGVADPASLVGSWTGTLDAGNGVRLRLRLVLSEAEGILTVAETLVARWNWETHKTVRFSYRLGAPVVTVKADTMSVSMSDIDASYTGTRSEDDGRITGTLTQGGEPFPLVHLFRSSMTYCHAAWGSEVGLELGIRALQISSEHPINDH